MSRKSKNNLLKSIQYLLKKHEKYLVFIAIALALILISLIALLFLVGGGNDGPTEDTSLTTENTTLQTDPDPTVTTQTDPVEDTKPYTHPLTGEALDAPFLGRPIAVMMNNINVAMPQHGNSQADIFYEVLAEGGVTRCMGIFTNIEKVEKIGSLRSARKYYIDIALGYGAAYVHAGGSDEALAYLKTLKNVDLNSALSGTHFYRDQDRLNSGYSLEHTLFTSGEKILDFAGKQKVTTALEEEKSYNMVFDDEKVYAGENAKKVTVYFNQGGTANKWTKSTALTYHEDTGLYSAFQHGKDYIDGNTKKTLNFRNVLVLKMATSLQPQNGYLLNINTVGSGDGYYICNGQKVDIQWSRDSLNEPFSYKLKNGEALTFATGKTYVAVVPTNATIEFQ